MLMFKKEKRVVELALRHIETTADCLEVMTNALKAFVSGKDDEWAETVDRENRLEHEADNLLREIRELLYSGAYLPAIRGDLYRLMSAVDDVANKSENCYDFVFYQKPQVTQEYRSEIIAIVELTLGCFLEFRQALETFFAAKGEVDTIRQHTKRVGELESLIDDNERALTARVFDSSLPLSEKLHLRRLIVKIVCVSDVIEDAADELELVSLKSIV